MCGIVGAIAKQNITKTLINGLKKLEYRGYDSAGIAVVNNKKQIERLRKKGKVKELETLVNNSSIHGNAGIAHTRWATHGTPSEQNAHPFMSKNEFALVHNGIIENHEELKTKLLEQGYTFSSETDSETIVHLLNQNFHSENNLLSAIKKTISQLKGAYALGIISTHNPETIIAVRHGSPLVVGITDDKNYFASDPLALLQVTQKFIYLEEGDIAVLTNSKVEIHDNKNNIVERKINQLNISSSTADRGEYRHFMCKEIFEQPKSIETNIEGRIVNNTLIDNAFGPDIKNTLKKTQHVQFIACGTSYHAAMVARYWLESIAGIQCSVEIASEFRYRNPIVLPNTLFVTLSQSGETADTLAALRLAKQKKFLSTLTICNVPESSLTRESEYSFMMRAGVEIGVASTKAFTAQLTALLMLTIALEKEHHNNSGVEKHLVTELKKIPEIIKAVLKTDDIIKQLAPDFADKEHALFLGRGALYPIALEGALKLKEISYIHAEGYPAGELKHGPLALVDKNMPVIVVAPNDELLEKLKSNLHEVRARGGELYVFTDNVKTSDPSIHIIQMPSVDPVIAPIIYTIALQLLAYHVAIIKGTDVDQPRNLAKSVTVE
ncbi:glutamine--fructose-6-phosphate transaminase (isomerizing) [Gammaproteobacteria bacterium]|nr:glutamine--fructose-6-phosphate transaminase (isomerizing) [Gammaproteobacteria bacterium]